MITSSLVKFSASLFADSFLDQRLLPPTTTLLNFRGDGEHRFFFVWPADHLHSRRRITQNIEHLGIAHGRQIIHLLSLHLPFPFTVTKSRHGANWGETNGIFFHLLQESNAKFVALSPRPHQIAQRKGRLRCDETTKLLEKRA